jgi:DNA helicase-2/ATP-dependent DNA helicase PcrA
MPLDLSHLNPEQRRAVEHTGGPLLVFAGAGTGKTRVITYRIAKLLEGGVAPHRVLAVTFTNKAANEMKERIASLVGPAARSLWMGTFHSICGRMLRQRGHAIGIDPNFVVYDDADQLSLIKQLMKGKGFDGETLQPRAILSAISRAKEQLLSPEEFDMRAAGYVEQVAATLYPEYNRALRRNNALDFDDMLLFAVRMMEERSDVATHYQNAFEHVLVDEFQDVNFAQYRLVQLLSARHRNVTVVGDDDQSIYSWRGADVRHIHQFGVDFEGAAVVKLERNYRSTQNILTAANAVIEQNSRRASKRLFTDSGPGAPVTVTETGTEEDEAMLVADTILRYVREKRRRFGDFAVLYRTNAQSRALEEAFMMMRIPHALIGGIRFYERKEIKDALAYLRLVVNPDDDVSFRRVINEPPRGIGAASLERIETAARASTCSLWNAVCAGVEGLTPKVARAVNAFQAAIQSVRDYWEERRKQDAHETEPLLRMILKESGILESLRRDGSADADERLDNLQELLNVAAHHDNTADEPGPVTFLQEVALVSDQDTLEEQKDDSQGVVTLMTVHTAKGLEFPVVFVVGLEEGVFPHSRSLLTNEEIEEERRLCYVAMTRAQEELHLTYATRRYSYGRTGFNDRSRFLDAIPVEVRSSLLAAPADVPTRSDLAAVAGRRVGSSPSPSRALKAPEWKPPFEVGQQVRHPKFGIGMVVSCIPTRGDCEVTVLFPGDVGQKRLLAGVAKLEAV